MYTITFEDDTQFKGGGPAESKWNEMPDKPIRKLEYFFRKQKVTLIGFESYNHIVERVRVMGHEEMITRVILMGRNGKGVDCFVYDLKQNTTYDYFDLFGMEYHGQSTKGWKKGIKTEKSMMIKHIL